MPSPAARFALAGYVFELRIAVGIFSRADLLLVYLERVVHLLEQFAHRAPPNTNPQGPQFIGNLLRRLPGPLQSAHRVASRLVFEQSVDGVHHFRRFFSTPLRPPPALRTRSVSRSWPSNSRRPRATV